MHDEESNISPFLAAYNICIYILNMTEARENAKSLSRASVIF